MSNGLYSKRPREVYPTFLDVAIEGFSPIIKPALAVVGYALLFAVGSTVLAKDLYKAATSKRSTDSNKFAPRNGYSNSLEVKSQVSVSSERNIFDQVENIDPVTGLPRNW